MAKVYVERDRRGFERTVVELNEEEEKQANVIGGCKCGLPGYECKPHRKISTVRGELKNA